MIYIFNGPPGSGKDEVCRYLVRQGMNTASFKEQLITDTLELFGVSREWFLDGYDDRSIKERPEERLNGLSRRGALIHTSENVKKVIHGQEYFGEVIAAKLDLDKDYCISDGGFVEELFPLIRKFGSSNIIVTQLARDGCTYANDSRYYVTGTLVGKMVIGHRTDISQEPKRDLGQPVATYELHNNGTIDELRGHATFITTTLTKMEKGRNV